jgi:WD40 repeat protein
MSFGRGGLNALKFSPSGSTILTAKDDFTVCLWGVGKDYNQIMTRCFDAHSSEWL